MRFSLRLISLKLIKTIIVTGNWHLIISLLSGSIDNRRRRPLRNRPFSRRLIGKIERWEKGEVTLAEALVGVTLQPLLEATLAWVNLEEVSQTAI